MAPHMEFAAYELLDRRRESRRLGTAAVARSSRDQESGTPERLATGFAHPDVPPSGTGAQ